MIESTTQDELNYSEVELRLANLCLDAIEKQKQEPDDAPHEEMDAGPETTLIDRWVPWDCRLCGWLFVVFALGSRDGRTDAGHRPLWLWRRVLLWGFRKWPLFRRMLWILRSGEAPDEVYTERWSVCNKCPDLKIARNGHAYCGSCGCVDWRKSRLLRKNRCRINHCPKRKHAGEYINLITAQWPNRKAQEPRRGGCGGGNNA